MKILLSGPTDGQIKKTYESLDPTCSWLLCTGNFGTWPDPKRLDRGTRNTVGAGDFAKLYVGGWQAPIQTLYVSGAHEDHSWLRTRFDCGNMEVLPSVHWLANGYRTSIGDWTEVVRVVGFGKVYSESTFNGKFNRKSYRHYTRKEFERACSAGPADLLLLHQAPNNKPTHHIIFATRPKLIVHAVDCKAEPYLVMNIPTIPLAKGEVKEVNYEKGEFTWEN